MCMRKKFDNDANAPNSESIWTSRFLFLLSGIGFLLGDSVRSYVGWAIIVNIELGMTVPLATLLSKFLLDVVLRSLMIKSFYWGREPFTAADDYPA